MDEGGHRAGLGQTLEVFAGLAQARAAKAHRADTEFAAHQVVQRNARGRDIAARLGRGELDAEGGEGLERLNFDERQLASARARSARIVPDAEGVAVSLEAAPGDGTR